MANKEYTLKLSDGMETTVLLSDEDAKARGLTGGKSSAATKSAAPDDKQATPADKSASKASTK